MNETGAQRSIFGSALAYKDPRAALGWLEKAFGFETTLLITDDQGNIAHSEMGFGSGYIMVGGEWAENIRSPSSTGGAITQRVSVHLPSGVDAHCERARAAGARIVMEPGDQPYGARVYVAVDREGHLWDFSEPREFSAQQMADAGMTVKELADEPDPGTFFPQAFYKDARGAISWLEKAFGFEPTMIIESDDGVRGHLAFEGCQLAVGSESWIEGWPARSSPLSAGGANTQTIQVQVRQGIDGLCERARGAGARIVAEPETQFYGDRTFRALDPEGHMWTFGQTVKAVSPEEWDAASGLKTEVVR